MTEKDRVDQVHEFIQEKVSIARFPSENPNPAFRLDRDGTVIFANPASQNLSPEWRFTPGDPAPQFWRDLAVEAYSSGFQRSIELSTPRGYFSFDVIPVDGGGYVNLYGRDVTERKRMEENNRFLAGLGEQLVRYNHPDDVIEAVVSGLGDYLRVEWALVCDIDRETGAYEIYCDSYHGDPAAATGQPRGILPAAVAQALDQGMPLVVDGNEPAADPIHSTLLQERLLPGFAGWIAVPRVDAGPVLRLLVVASRSPREWRDDEIALTRSIAEMTWMAFDNARLFQGLRESQERLQLALQHSSIMVCNTDLDLCYTWVNNPILNLPAEAMLGKRDTDLFPARDVQEMVALKHAVVQSGAGARKTVRLKIGGEKRTYDITVEPLREKDGSVSGLTVVLVDLTDQVRRDVERREAETQIEVHHRLMQQREMERVQIARDLHDGPLQQLYAVTFALPAVFDLASDERQVEQLKAIEASLQQQIADIRALCGELRPPTLAKFGLEKAIRAHVETFLAKHPEITIDLDLQPDGQRLPEEARLGLFRIYQETLNNVVRHAEASRVEVRFTFDKKTIELVVKDNGVGFKVPRQWVDLARRGHLGLVGVQERAQEVGGDIRVESAPGKGTIVRVTVPRTAPALKTSA